MLVCWTMPVTDQAFARGIHHGSMPLLLPLEHAGRPSDHAAHGQLMRRWPVHSPSLPLPWLLPPACAHRPVSSVARTFPLLLAAHLISSRVIFSLKCCLPAWRAMTLPDPVILNRLAAACAAMMGEPVRGVYDGEARRD